jgi:hypothetical protein
MAGRGLPNNARALPPTSTRRDSGGTCSPRVRRMDWIEVLSMLKFQGPEPYFCGMLVRTKPIDACPAQTLVTSCQSAQVSVGVLVWSQAEFLGKIIFQKWFAYPIFSFKPDRCAVIALKSQPRIRGNTVGNILHVGGKFGVFEKKRDQRQGRRASLLSESAAIKRAGCL